MNARQEPLDRLKKELRRFCALTGAVAWLDFLPFGALLVTGLVVRDRWLGNDALPRWPLWWGGTSLGLLALAVFRAWPRAARRNELARRLDAAHDARGAVLTAAFVLSAPEVAGRFGPLVLAQAEAALGSRTAVSDLGVRLRHATVVRALVAVVLSFLVAAIPAHGLKSVGGDVLESLLPADPPSSKTAADEPVKEPTAGDPLAVDLGDLARLEIQTDRKIYLLEEEISVAITLTTTGVLAEETLVDVVLAVTDGLPSKDEGFGVGFRLIRFTDPWRVPAEAGQVLRRELPVLTRLKELGIYQTGLFTFVAGVAPHEENAGLTGGTLSNQLTVQVSPNRERQQVRSNTPTAKQRTPKAPAPKPSEQKRAGRQRSGGPAQGGESGLGDVKREAHAVQPLLSDAPLVEKEVNVFDREKGDGPEPPRPEIATPQPLPLRTFLALPEEAMRLPVLSSKDAGLVRRYFEKVSGR